MTKSKNSVLSERQEMVLDALIREYTKTARPVGSLELLRRLRLAVSPATVRNELMELCEAGYLLQPHTSAGRVPTDQGYRFFVDHLLDETDLESSENAMIRRVFAIRGEDEFLGEFGRVVSEITSTFAAVGFRDKDFIFETGLSEVIDEPEFENPKMVREFGELVDRIGRDSLEFFERFADTEDRVFIGEEHPWGFESLSVCVSEWSHPRGFRGYMALVGPKRMNYEKQKAVAKKVRVINEE